jgi:hypothetical protein
LKTIQEAQEKMEGRIARVEESNRNLESTARERMSSDSAHSMMQAKMIVRQKNHCTEKPSANSQMSITW